MPKQLAQLASMPVLLIAVLTLSGQTRPQFEVASLKISSDASGRTLVQAFPGRLVMQNFTPKALVFFAYGVADYQIDGGPSWIGSDRYDVQAKAMDASATVQQLEGPMLQSFLEDRFKLAFHHETRQLPVYDLSIAYGTSKLQPAKSGACIPYRVDSTPPRSAAGEPRPVFCGYPKLAADGLKRTLDGAAIDIAKLAGNLSRLQIARACHRRDWFIRNFRY